MPTFLSCFLVEPEAEPEPDSTWQRHADAEGYLGRFGLRKGFTLRCLPHRARARAFAITTHARNLRMAVFHANRKEPWRREETQWSFDVLAPSAAQGS